MEFKWLMRRPGDTWRVSPILHATKDFNAWAAPPFLRSDSHGALHWREKAAPVVGRPEAEFRIVGVVQKLSGFTRNGTGSPPRMLPSCATERFLWLCQ